MLLVVVAGRRFCRKQFLEVRAVGPPVTHQLASRGGLSHQEESTLGSRGCCWCWSLTEARGAAPFESLREASARRLPNNSSSFLSVVPSSVRANVRRSYRQHEKKLRRSDGILWIHEGFGPSSS